MNRDASRPPYGRLALGLFSLGALVAMTNAAWHHAAQPGSFSLEFLAITYGMGLAVTALWMMARLGYQWLSSRLLVGLFGLGTIILVWLWSIELPQSALTFAITLFLAAVLLTRKELLWSSLLLIIAVLGIAAAQVMGYTTPELGWSDRILRPGDTIEIGLGFLTVAVAAWICNRALAAFLEQARSSEAELTKERNALEVTVAERTRQLERTQAERIIELERFAEFGHLTAGLLHDLAHPLTSASLSLELLSERERSQLLSQARKNLGQLQRYVVTARNHLNQPSEHRPLDVHGELQAAIELVAHRAKAAGVTIQLSDTEGLMIVGDGLAFSRICTNLIANAIDALAERHGASGSAIVSIIGSSSLDTVTLRFENRGACIPADSLDHVFKSSYSTKRAQGKGSGLGLAIVKQLVEERCGGTIKVTSTEAEGTVFVVRMSKDGQASALATSRR